MVLTVPEMLAALDRHPIEIDRDTYLKRALAMELIELDQLATAFRARALVDRDPATAAILLKVAERRARCDTSITVPIGNAAHALTRSPATPDSLSMRKRAPL
jgi:hypothetical protein